MIMITIPYYIRNRKALFLIFTNINKELPTKIVERIVTLLYSELQHYLQLFHIGSYHHPKMLTGFFNHNFVRKLLLFQCNKRVSIKFFLYFYRWSKLYFFHSIIHIAYTFMTVLNIKFQQLIRASNFDKIQKLFHVNYVIYFVIFQLYGVWSFNDRKIFVDVIILNHIIK